MKGTLFEKAVRQFLASQNKSVSCNFTVSLGVGETKRPHNFDLGSNDLKIAVECKAHTWTKGGNVPSAKIAAWNEAMYYFYLLSDEYLKMMFVLLDRLTPESETLLEYYIRRFYHLIPCSVEIWEFDVHSFKAKLIHPAKSIRHNNT